MESLLWTCPSWSPYNNYLFRELRTGLEARLEVLFIKNRLASHPWKSSATSDYRASTLHAGVLGWCELIGKTARGEFTEVVLAGWNYPSVLLLWILAFLANVPYAVWTDTPRISDRSRPLRRALLYCMLRGAARVWGTGQVAMDRLAELGARKATLANLPYIVDLNVLRPRQKPGSFQRGRLEVVSCGRLVNEEKGYDRGVLAFANLCAANRTNFHYTIIGDGPDRRIIEQLIEANHLTDTVTIAGWLNDAEIAERLSAAHIFLHPSAFDPFAVAVLEAMACGLVVVGSNEAMSICSRVSDQESGIVLRDTAPSHIAAALESLAARREKLPEMAARSRAAAETWPASRALAVVAELLNAKGGQEGCL